MSTEFYVDLKDMNICGRELVPPELVMTANDGKLQIGTSYNNADRRRAVVDLINGNIHTYATIAELGSSGKPYFSKWSKDSPIEFFDAPIRFSWHIPLEFQEPSEEIDDPENYQTGMLDFWDSFLHDETPVYHGSPHPIETWKDLKDAIFGERRSMEPSSFVQGNTEMF